MKRRLKLRRATMGSGSCGLTRPMRLQTVAQVYKTLWTVEQSFRTAKAILETRPIYHQNDAGIRGRVFCSLLVLRLKAELERRLKVAGAACEWCAAPHCFVGTGLVHGRTIS